MSFDLAEYLNQRSERIVEVREFLNLEAAAGNVTKAGTAGNHVRCAIR